MSIYWNQRKGQYETNNFYGAQQQQQQNKQHFFSIGSFKKSSRFVLLYLNNR